MNITNLNVSDLGDIAERSVRKKEHLASLNMFQVEKIMKFFNITCERFLDNSYCERTLVEQLVGNEIGIPDKYIGNKGSSVLTIKNSIQNLNEYFKGYFFREFQLDEKFLDDDNRKVCVRLLKTSLALSRYQDGDSAVFDTGFRNAGENFQKIEQETKKESSLIKSFCNLIEYSETVEKNRYYNIEKANSDNFIFTTQATEETRSILGEGESMSELFINNIHGFVDGYAAYTHGKYVTTDITLSSDEFGKHIINVAIH